MERAEVILEREKQLLISFIKPHKTMSTSTVSRWLINVLSAASIDTNTFTAHSTHAASSSKLKAHCAPTKEILKRGSWSNYFTFEKFYHKEILPEGN